MLDDGEIRLREHDERDVPGIVAACRDPEIPRWTQVPSPYTEADARAYVDDFPNARAIADATSDELLGSIGWRWVDGNVQVGYWVKRGPAGGARRRERSDCSPSGRSRSSARLRPAPDGARQRRLTAGGREGGLHARRMLRSFIDLKGRRRDAFMFGLLPEDLV